MKTLNLRIGGFSHIAVSVGILCFDETEGIITIREDK